MTARELQEAMAEDLKELFSDARYKTPEGGMAAPGIYKQALPKQESFDPDEEEEPFPYIIVRIDSGTIETPRDPHKITMVLLVGVYDDSLDNSGHVSVLEILERIQMHYQEKPLLKQFAYTDPFKWALQDEPSWPHFFGAASVNFNAPAPRVRRSVYT